MNAKLMVYLKTYPMGDPNFRSVKYDVEDIVCIKHHLYKDLAKTDSYDLGEYKKSEIFMEICFKNGDTAMFPCSTWNLEFTS